jgi:peptide/nickel transport system substrate-binding protein
MSSRRIRCFTAVAASLSLVLAACGGDDDATSEGGTTADTATDDATDDATEGTTEPAASDEPAEASADETLTIAINGDPQSLDPGKNGGGRQQAIQYFAYEPLIRAKADGSFEPALAESWEYTTDDNTVFEMTLRPDVVFADGSPVTTESVVQSIEYFIATPSPVHSLIESVASVEAVDDTTVRVTFSESNPGAPNLFSQATNYGSVINPVGLENPDQLGTATFGAGAYVLDTADTVSGDRYTLVPNANYWNPDLQHWGKVVVRVIGDPNTALNAVRTGQINVSTITTPAQLSEAEDAELDLVLGGQIPILVWIMDRNGEVQPALGDVRVREALNLAIDRDTIAKALGDAYSPLSQFGAPGGEAYVDDREPIPYDPERAVELLTEAGFADGFDLALASNTDNRDDEVSQILAQQWGDIGINVDLQVYDNQPSEMFAAIANFEHGAITFALNLELAAGQALLTQEAVFNPWGATDADVEAAYEAWAAAPEDQVDAAADDVVNTINDLYWFVPVASVDDFFISQGVDNLGTLAPDALYDALDWTPAP